MAPAIETLLQVHRFCWTAHLNVSGNDGIGRVFASFDGEGLSFRCVRNKRRSVDTNGVKDFAVVGIDELDDGGINVEG